MFIVLKWLLLHSVGVFLFNHSHTPSSRDFNLSISTLNCGIEFVIAQAHKQFLRPEPLCEELKLPYKSLTQNLFSVCSPTLLIASTNPFYLSLMKVQAAMLSIFRLSTRNSKNQVHDDLLSDSASTNAIRKIELFPSIPTTTKI